MCFLNICIFEYFPMIIIFKKQFKKSQQLTSHFKREPNSYNNLHELHPLIICLTQLPHLFNLTLVKTDSALPPRSHDSPTVIPSICPFNLECFSSWCTLVIPPPPNGKSLRCTMDYQVTMIMVSGVRIHILAGNLGDTAESLCVLGNNYNHLMDLLWELNTSLLQNPLPYQHSQCPKPALFSNVTLSIVYVSFENILYYLLTHIFLLQITDVLCVSCAILSPVTRI